MENRSNGPRLSVNPPERMPMPTRLQAGVLPGELGIRGEFPYNITTSLWSKTTYHMSGNSTHRHLCHLNNGNYAFYEAAIYRDRHSIPIEDGTIWIASGLAPLINMMNNECYKTYLEETYAVDANGCPLNPEEAVRDDLEQVDFGPFQTATHETIVFDDDL